MSYGKLCGDKIKINRSMNSVTNELEVSCDLYEGHEGEHSKMLYHCVKSKQGHIDNYRMGDITWQNEWKQLTTAKKEGEV